MRKVIFHYHFFKNAGTSVDALLKTNFSGQWAERAFQGEYAANIAQVSQWVQHEKDIIAFSSHSAMLPPPKLADVEFFPIVFVRHPIDRIASSYAFASKYRKGDLFSAVLARNTTLAGYIEVYLSMKRDRECRNYHVSRLAEMFKGEAGDETILALQALDTLPFVGLVEEFDRSIKRMTEWLSPHFPGFHSVPFAQNVNRDRSIPIEQRLEQIKAEIGEACYEQLLEANAGDVAVFEAVRKRILA